MEISNFVFTSVGVREEKGTSSIRIDVDVVLRNCAEI